MLSILKKSKWYVVVFMALVIILVLHNVSKRFSESDLFVLPQYLDGMSIQLDAADLSFEEQVLIISQLQQNMLSIAPEDKGIPEGQERGIQQLSFWGYGLCYDKSYALETLLEHLGFTTRHVSIYANPKGTSFLKDFSTPGILSHACTEVRTKSGWMVIDPNFSWIALDTKGNPVSLESEEMWKDSNNFYSPPPYPIYIQDHHIVYGLYSRHGQFFWPYSVIPDYNIRGLLYNF
jgi:hypothetical protein